MDERVNCVVCILREGYEPGVTIINGITHALAAVGCGYIFRLCDFDRDDVLKSEAWPARMVNKADILPPLMKARSEPRLNEVLDEDTLAPGELLEGPKQQCREADFDRVGHRDKVSPGL